MSPKPAMLDRVATISQTPVRPDESRAMVNHGPPRGPKVDFAAAAKPQSEPEAQAETASQAAPDTAAQAATGFPHLRRRTDLAETGLAETGAPASKAEAADLPPHLERRRAWREAKGIGTFHAQNLAQNQESVPDAEQRAAAHGLYRQWGGRGQLDIDLAQRISVTV